MRKQFKNTVMELACSDERIMVLLGDVSVYLFNDFKNKYPRRFYNVGINENTMVSMSAGLSSQGFTPFVHTITPFITERCYEQIKLDLCYNSFGGNIVSCGASFDYAWDGATHHCFTDLAILRLLPGMEVIQPGSTKELDVLLRATYADGRPTYLRLSDHPHTIDLPVEFGKGVVIKNNDAALTVMTAGPILANVLEACRDLPVNLLYFHTIKPIDAELIRRFQSTRLLVIHDALGLYEAITSLPGVAAGYHGLKDQFCGWYGTLADIRGRLGLDVAGIRAAVASELRQAG